MSVQLALRFDEVPITCETQQRYHSISPCLAGRRSAEEQADALGLSYSAVCRWLRKFREEGMPGLGWRCLIRCGFVIRRTWPPRVFKDQRKNNRLLSS
jgi:Homeodomain-like domain-containing protein